MHDHNLDDLIIHDIPPMKSTKSKSFLTILALLVVVFIVAILLIKTLFSTPDANDIVVDESASFRSSELKLQAPKKDTTKPKAPVTKKADAKKQVVKKPVVKKPVVVKEATISPEPKPSATPKKAEKPVAKKPEKPVAKKPVAKPETQKPAEVKKPEAKKPVVKKPVVKKETAQKPAEVAKAVKAEETYFVQVGSFTKNPSERFLSVIKNSGFKYSITDNGTNGTKKLLIGPYESRSAVDAALVKVRDRISKSAFVTKK